MYSRLIVDYNRYVDSVSLMQVRDRAMKVSGAIYAEVQMATPANVKILKELGFSLPERLSGSDLVIGISAKSEEAADAILALVRELLDRGADVGDGEESYASLDEIDWEQTGYNLVQISLPGEYAAAEARKAIEKGCDVFIFSDNVPLEQELMLKQLGREKGCLVMGPDCGVGLINGVCLGAGSIVRKGAVGIVGASGSGAQEVACIVEKCGCGVSQIIGTGGRDLYPEIGGITMLEGIRRLEQDPETKVIALVSKLADRQVMDRVLTYADSISKPVTAVFLGGGEELFAGHRTRGTVSLEGCAVQAVELLTGKRPAFGCSDEDMERIARQELAQLAPEQRYFRGLFCGGTFTEESLIYFNAHNPGVPLYSNLATAYAGQLDDPEQSKGNTILDLGAEDFTEKLPHPVFDAALRVDRLRRELVDPKVAVVMLDFITGPGVDDDPFTDIAAVCAQTNSSGRHVIFLAAVCGSENDPQNVAERSELLRRSGMIVTGSNYQSTKLASLLMAGLAERA